MKRRIGIIGGGASGMVAAITAAREGAVVTILEGGPRLGKKILSTGNGKCNLGNRQLDSSWYYTENPRFLQARLEQFGTEETIAFFQGIGLMIKEKSGYLYPVSEQAAVVTDVLRYEVDALGVNVITGCKVRHISREKESADRQKGNIRVEAEDGTRYSFDRVILACGGRAAPATGSDGSGYRLSAMLGHHLIPVVPALVQLKCREDYLKAVAGVRAQARIGAYRDGKQVAAEWGELQITDYGISGIPVFQISRVVNYIIRDGAEEVEIAIDFFPDYAEQDYENFCQARALLQQGRTVEEFFTGMLNKKLMALFIKMAGLTGAMPVADAAPGQLEKVYRFCRQWKVHVTGSNAYENAQVCAGGVPLSELTDRMESKCCPGVYLAGELLDVDGKCGGYNLQWAWCSGYLAGKSAAMTA